MGYNLCKNKFSVIPDKPGYVSCLLGSLDASCKLHAIPLTASENPATATKQINPTCSDR